MTHAGSGKPREQFSLKMSHDTTLEEFQAQIRTIPGNEQFTITAEDFAKVKARIQAQAFVENAIKSIIDPLEHQLIGLSARQKADKTKELRYLAQYFVASKSSMQVINIQESPDFIAQHNGKRIGIELTRLVDTTVIAEANAFRQMLDAAQNRLSSKYPTIKQLYRFDVDLCTIVIKDKLKIIDDLVNIVHSQFEGTLQTLPAYIRGIYSQDHDRLSLTLTESYILKPLASSNLTGLIQEKETRLPQYQSNAQTDDIILLMIMEGAGSKSNYDLNAFVLPHLHTRFSKIVLLEEFDLTIHTLYP